MLGITVIGGAAPDNTPPPGPAPSAPAPGAAPPMTVIPSIPDQHLPYPPGIHEMPILPPGQPGGAAPAAPGAAPSQPAPPGGAPQAPGAAQIATALQEAGVRPAMIAAIVAEISYFMSAGLRPEEAMQMALRHMRKGGHPQAEEPVVVGEQGPEVFVPDRPGTVIPAMTPRASDTAWE